MYPVTDGRNIYPDVAISLHSVLIFKALKINIGFNDNPPAETNVSIVVFNCLEWLLPFNSNDLLHLWNVANSTFIYIPYTIWWVFKLPFFEPSWVIFKELFNASWIYSDCPAYQLVACYFLFQVWLSFVEVFQPASTSPFLGRTKSCLLFSNSNLVGQIAELNFSKEKAPACIHYHYRD